MKALEEQRNVKWILAISVIMFFASFWFSQTMFYISPYYPQQQLSFWDYLGFYSNRISILLFIATITTATLFTTEFAEESMYKLTIYLFIAAMGLLFTSSIKWLIMYPYIL